MLDEDEQSWMDLTETKGAMVAMLSKVTILLSYLALL